MDEILGIHAQALRFRARRAEVLAANLANADTPGYKARDIDFRAALGEALRQGGQAGGALRTTHARHMTPASGVSEPEVKYRVPDQPSLDQNTVDSQREQAAFTQNALRYQASLRFLNGRVSGLMTAIKGE